MEAKIKIIYVITSSGVGGAEKILYHTIAGLDPVRYSIRLCSLKQKGAVARSLERQGFEVYSLNMREGNSLAGWLDSLRALFLLTRYLRKEKPRIVHSFLYRANIISRIAAQLSGVPVCISSIRVMGGESHYYHLIEQMTAFMVDYYTAVSEQVKNYTVARARIPAGKIAIIHNGVVLESGTASHRELPGGFGGLKPGDRVVMTAGRLHRQKGYDCLLRAIAEVQETFHAVKLLILGEGEEENNLKKLAESLELTERVVFAGLCSEPQGLFARAELFVLASRWEGMPNVLLEAMAAGKPVVATEVGGIPELVIPDVTGVLVSPEDVQGLAYAIEGLLGDEKRAQAMGFAGRERVAQHFSIPAMMKKTETLYQQLLEGKHIA